MYEPIRNVIEYMSNIMFNVQNMLKKAQRRAAAETVARKPIEHFIHSINN